MLGKALRADFPQFASNPNLVYLDSAATSLTPEPVLESMQEYYRTYRSNAHRGLYREAQKATEMMEQARARIASFIGADSDEIIFTAGATSSANMLVRSLEESALLEGATIVASAMEHHAILLPLQGLARRKGLTLQCIGANGVLLDMESARTLISKDTALVAVTLASNVTGSINDVRTIIDATHACGALAIVDGTAAVGHMSVDVKALDVDFLFFSGHKMCGPTGIGVLYGKKELLERLKPSVVGGGIVRDVTFEDASFIEGAKKFEAGTQHIAGCIGLARAVAYLESLSMDAIRTHAFSLVTYAYEALTHEEGVSVYAMEPEKNVGIVSFTLEGAHPHDIADIAGSAHVAVRAGHHCAQPFHDALGVPATVRASFYVYNDTSDIDVLIQSIRRAKEIFS